MALSSDMPHPVVVQEGEANWWGVIDLDIRTPLGGPNSVAVTYLARELAEDHATQLFVSEQKRVLYDGDRLLAIMADAFARAVVAQQYGASPDQALYLGIRNAVYAALQADGCIPGDAK